MSQPAETLYGLPAVMASLRIRVVLDVGANCGQFAQELRRNGFDGQIISFEPIPVVAAALHSNARDDPHWETRQYALGELRQTRMLRVSANTVSSSFLEVEERTLLAEPTVGIIDTIQVHVERLDGVWPELRALAPEGAVMLKLDVQGAEPQVLEGAAGMLADVSLILAESSLVPIYRDEMLLERLLPTMRGLGFFPIWLRPGWCNSKTGQVYQCDVAFARSEDLPSP